MPRKLQLNLDPPTADRRWPEVACQLVFQQGPDFAEERNQGVHEVSVLMNCSDVKRAVI